MLTQSPDGTFAINRLEIFRVGDYGSKGSYTEADLAQIAEDYNASVHEAPVTVDHVQGGEAFGWVTRVYAEGGKLFADLAKIPSEFAAKLKDGRWKKRSVEIYQNLKETGRKYLKAVTFLGAAAPEVKGMTDPAFGEDEHGQWESFGNGGSVEKQEPSAVEETKTQLDEIKADFSELRNLIEGIVSEMSDNEKQEKTESMSEQKFAELQAELAKMREGNEALIKQNQELEKRFNEEAAKRESAEAEAAFNEAFNAALKDEKGARVAPAEREALRSIFMALPKDGDAVKFGENEVTGQRNIFAEWLKRRPVIAPAGDEVPFDQNMKDKTSDFAETIKDRARQLMADDDSLDMPSAMRKAAQMMEREKK